MKPYKFTASALAIFSLGVLPAAAQERGGVEVVPFVALGTQGASPLGTVVTFPIGSAFAAETEVAYRRAEGPLNALSTNTSLLWFLPRVGKAEPYLAAGVGLAQYGAAVVSFSGQSVGAEPRVATTVNVGGGLKMTMREEIALRTDARWFKSLGGREHFRVAQGIAIGLGRR